MYNNSPPPTPYIPARLRKFVEKLRDKAFPSCLINERKFQIYDAIIRNRWAHMDDHGKHRYLLSLGRDSLHDDPVSVAMANLTVTYAEAVVVVGHLLGISPEYVFGAFPGAIEPVEDRKPVSLDVPETLVVNGHYYRCEINDLQYDFSGKPLFAVLGYTSKTAPSFWVLGARKKDFAGFWSLELGKASAPNILIGAAKIEQNRMAMIVLPKDINVALDSRQLTKSVMGLERNFVVSGSTQELNTMQLNCLMFRVVILLPEFSLEGLRGVIYDAKLLLKAVVRLMD